MDSCYPWVINIPLNVPPGYAKILRSFIHGSGWVLTGSEGFHYKILLPVYSQHDAKVPYKRS